MSFFDLRHRLPVLCALAACLWLAAGSGAAAQEQFRAPTWDKPSGQIGLRYGTDNLNFGLGLHGGYTIEPGIYIGGLFDYFFGESEDFGGGAEYSFSAWTLMLEGGYDFGVMENLVLRPVLALGVLGVSSEVCGGLPGAGGGCVDASDTDLQFGLGGHVLYVIDSITVGGELRLLLGQADAFMLGANVGMIL